MQLAEDLQRIADIAASYADEGERLDGVLAAEPASGERLYLCAYARGEERAWLVLDASGAPLGSRARVRDAVTIAAMCELAEETAGGGDLTELRSQLVTLRLTENPPGIDEAEDAALALERAIAPPPRVATPEYLDSVGAATRRLERALGGESSPFAAAMQASLGSVEALAHEVETRYKRPLG